MENILQTLPVGCIRLRVRFISIAFAELIELNKNAIGRLWREAGYRESRGGEFVDEAHIAGLEKQSEKKTYIQTTSNPNTYTCQTYRCVQHDTYANRVLSLFIRSLL